MDTTHSILRSAKLFFAGTFLSRITGMVREIAMAFCFGSAPELAAFMVAYRFASLFRRLLGEGNLQAGFVPHFEAARSENLRKAILFYRDTSFSLGLVLIGLILVLETILWGCLHWGGSSDWKEIIELAMWMVPGLFFICLYALNSSLLQCQKSYFLPAVAPVAFNFIWTIAVIFVWHLPKIEAVRCLSVVVTGAFAAQWLATAFAERRFLRESVSWKEWMQPRLFSGEWKGLMKAVSLGIWGVGAVQFNSAFDAIFSRIADLKGPTFLWYAIRLEQLPLALFGIALSGALLPPLARAMTQGNLDLYRQLLGSALRHSVALMIPCTFGIFALGGVGVNFLYGHGNFSPEDVRETVACLWGYGVGLVPSVFVILLAGGFYAQKSYRTPTLSSLLAVGANIGLNALFVFVLQWGAVSIAIATSISAWLNAWVLAYGLERKVGTVFQGGFWPYFLKVTLCSAAPAGVVLGLQGLWMGGAFPRAFFFQTFDFLIFTAIYILGVAGMAWWLKVEEFGELLKGRRLIREK